MSQAFNIAKYGVTAIGLTVALSLAPCGFVPSAAAAEAQLAQAPPAGGQQSGDQQVDLKSKLQITPAQEAKFNAVMQIMQQNEASLEALAQRGSSGPHNAIAELRAQAQAAQTEAQGLQKLIPVFEALYSSMSVQQKQLADQMFAGPPAGNEPPPQNK